MPQHICPQCQEPFNVKTSRLNRSQTVCCSKKCASRYIVASGKYLGDKNPNHKYEINYTFLDTIDTDEKAYFLGWIASDGHISTNGSIIISIHQKDSDILRKLRDLISNQLPISKKNDMITLAIHNTHFATQAIKHLKLESFGKKAGKIVLPDLPENLLWAFIRGLFDGDGSVSKLDNQRYPRCNIASISLQLKEQIRDFVKIPCNLNQDSICYSGNNALDFLAKLYDKAPIYLSRKKDLYECWASYVPSKHGLYTKIDSLQFCKTTPEAITPYKNRISDSGYDLSLIKLIKKVNNIYWFDTGIKIKPPYGMYFDLVPRSSICKTGFILKNGTAILDRTYVGTIIVVLEKIDLSMPDLELPSRMVQIIPRDIVHLNLEEVEELSPSERDKGGFGSTGV